MNKLILCTFFILSLPLYAQDSVVENLFEPVDQPMEEHAPEEVVPAKVLPAPSPALYVEKDLETDKKFNPRKSHWAATFAFENTKYQVFPEDFTFQGKKKFKSEDQQLWGGRIGLGGEIYLGAGFVTRSMLETYYIGTMFSQVLNGGDEDADVKFAYTKKTGQILGADVSQSLGWMFDLKTKNPFMDEMTYLTVETYVEAGIGKAYAYNRINYSYDLDVTDEAFKVRTRDDLLNAKVGAGINMTSSRGFFLALKATVNRYEITQRKVDGFTKPNGQASPTPINESPKNAKIDPVVIYTLGGGYKF